MKDIYYTKPILNIIKPIRIKQSNQPKMNPIENTENIENIYIIENIVNDLNNLPIGPVVNIGPPPVFQRSNTAYIGLEEPAELIIDANFREFQFYDTPNDYVMPTPCPRCYWICCNGDCSLEQDEMLSVARQLSFEEEMELLPPPPCLTRMLTNAHLPPDEPEDEAFPVPVPRHLPRPLTRMLTNSHLPPDEPEEFYMPEDLQYVSLKVIIEDKENEQDEQNKEDEEEQ